MKVPFHKPYITDDEVNAVASVLRSGWLTMGSVTIDFERLFREYTGARNAVAVNSATSALHLALRAIDLRDGDEVIVPSLTFVATAEVVRYFNAVPVIADIEFDTHLIDAAKLEALITPRTRDYTVHYAGQPCDMDELCALAARHHLHIIEDAAHSLPAWYGGRKIGTLGDITCFSFYATKTLATGEGGMITTDSDEWAARMGSLRLHGIGRDAWNRYSEAGSWMYDVGELGYKYNITDIASAIGIEQLKKLEWMRDRRVEIAGRYAEAFASMDAVIPYTVKDGRVSAWHLYPAKLNLDALTITRDRFIGELASRGVGASVHFIPLYRFTYYKNMGYECGAFPQSERVFERIISLPIYPGMNDETGYVIQCIDDIARQFKR